MANPVPSENVIVPPDIELFLTGWLREQLKRRGHTAVQVDNKEPADTSFPLAAPVVVVRHDGGAQTSPVTFDSSVGITVLGGTRQNTKPVMDVARLVFALATSLAVCLAKGSPIAATITTTSTPPYLVNETADAARAYMAIDYSVTGDAIAIP